MQGLPEHLSLHAQRLDKSGKGVALLKASRLQSDLEFLEKENSVLYGDLKAKVRMSCM